VDTQGDYGAYANAFRIMQDGNDVVLDFCVYSEQDNAARTVSRVRVPPTFLNVILARLQDAMSVPASDSNERLYVMPEIKGLN
jgi:hypothetical protein